MVYSLKWADQSLLYVWRLSSEKRTFRRLVMKQWWGIHWIKRIEPLTHCGVMSLHEESTLSVPFLPFLSIYRSTSNLRGWTVLFVCNKPKVNNNNLTQEFQKAPLTHETMPAVPVVVHTCYIWWGKCFLTALLVASYCSCMVLLGVTLVMLAVVEYVRRLYMWHAYIVVSLTFTWQDVQI